MLAAVVVTPRFAVYATCVVAALLVSCLLGKDMTWDTLHYHLYAGFSALHGRFGQDYFAAGAQSYFNPYVYVPFYLLATSRLTALTAASILAVLQSGLLWLTYELALAAVPQATPGTRIAIGVCAALLALANPILINELGASSADVITAEIVLGGWLLSGQAPGRGTASRRCDRPEAQQFPTCVVGLSHTAVSAGGPAYAAPLCRILPPGNGVRISAARRALGCASGAALRQPAVPLSQRHIPLPAIPNFPPAGLAIRAGVARRGPVASIGHSRSDGIGGRRIYVAGSQVLGPSSARCNCAVPPVMAVASGPGRAGRAGRWLAGFSLALRARQRIPA